MKTRNKALLLALCAVLLVCSAVFGTLAYLTDTEAVENTFTVGRVGIFLDEAVVNEDGKAVLESGGTTLDTDQLKNAKRTEKGNAYHLLPGHTYVKDPTVHIDPKSEAAYYRMIVTVSFETALSDENLAKSLDGIFTGYDVTKWALGGNKKIVSDDKKSITYEYRYHTTVANQDEKNAVALEPLFTRIVVPGELTNAQLAVFGQMKIDIVAHAIQADGFATADQAWAAFPTT